MKNLFNLSFNIFKQAVLPVNHHGQDLGPVKVSNESAQSVYPSKFMRHPALNEVRGLRDAFIRTSDSHLVRPRTFPLGMNRGAVYEYLGVCADVKIERDQSFIVDLAYCRKNYPNDVSKWPVYIKSYYGAKNSE
jgi:hypothetical protein